MTVTIRLLTLTAICALAACDSPPPTWDLERMMNQAHYRPYEASDLFADGRAMRVPPAGVVPMERESGSPLFTRGQDNGVYASAIPLPITRPLLNRGRDRFDIHCAACHGVLGDGDSAVGARMDLRRPPPIAGPMAGHFPPGRDFVVITEGYGLMRSYAHELSVADRWAIVAYLRALDISERARLQDLPAPLQGRARKVLQ